MMARGVFSLSLLHNRFPALHGLRVLAILGVIQVHVTDAYREVVLGEPAGMATTSWEQTLSLNGWFAMDLFFLMSGFLIGDLLFAAFSEPTAATSRFARFYARRAFRTFPLYYAFYFLYFALTRVVPALVTPVARTGFQGVTLNELLYLTNYPFAAEKYLVYWSWSLSLEEHFYLVSPLLVFGLTRLRSHRARLLVLGALWGAAPVVRGVIYWSSFHGTLNSVARLMYTPTHARFDVLIAGLALAYLVRHFGAQVRGWARTPVVSWLLLVLPLAIFALFLSPTLNPTPLGFLLLAHPEYVASTALAGIAYYGTLTSVAYGCLVLRVVFVDDWLARALSHRVFLVVATLGYGIYLVHLPIAYALVPMLHAMQAGEGSRFWVLWLSGTVATFVASATLASVLHLLIEKPALAVRDRLVP